MVKRLNIIGLGNMGSSLVRGILNSAWHKNYELYVYDTHESLREVYQGQNDVNVMSSLMEVKKAPSLTVLCFKPQDLLKFGEALRGSLPKGSLIVSVLAGVPLAEIGLQLEYSGAIVRVMPNIAAKVGEAATAACGNVAVGEDEVSEVTKLFQAVGECYWVKEALMDTVTGLSGSGPAYIYMVIEALTDGGVMNGLPRDLARKLATQTVLGAATLVKTSGEHPAILKDQVTTPAGTTISALVELETHGLRSMFVAAVSAATARSKELGRMKS